MAFLSRILAPVAFCSRCRQAAQHAASLADSCSSELVLLHVVGPPMLRASRAAAEGVQRSSEMAAFLDSRFARLSIVQEVIEGDPAQTIVDYARLRTVDLIVMAPRGHGPFRPHALGSVTTKVLQKAPCPTWTGRHVEDFVEHEPGGFRRLVCAVDLGSDSPSVLQWAESMARELRAGLGVVHLLPDSTAQLGDIYFDDDWRREAAHADTSSLPIPGPTSLAVKKLSARWNADLLVISRTRDAVSDIRRNAPCPVVAI